MRRKKQIKGKRLLVFLLVVVIPFVGWYYHRLQSPEQKELASYYTLMEKTLHTSTDSTESRLLHPKTDFLQPWMLHDWKYEDYKLYLEKIKELGMEYVVLQYVAGAKIVDGKAVLTENYFHMNDNDANPYLSLVYSKCTNKKNMIVSQFDVVDNLLSAAKEAGIKVYLGTILNEQWWDNHFLDDRWHAEMLALEKLLLSYFIAKYENTSYMSDTFYGIYYTPEMFGNTNGYEIPWREALENIREFVYSQDPSLKFIVSLYCSEYYLFDDSDEQAAEEKMHEFVFDLLVNNGKPVLKNGDIVSVQDKLSTNPKTSVEYNTKFLYAVRDVLEILKYDYNTSLHYSIIVENFKSESDLNLASIERYNLQRLICSQLADDLMVFSYALYQMPKDGRNKPIK